MAGDYNLQADALDFRGALKLRAKVSQTMTGWKGWALKPVGPLFSKNGAGTFLRIKVSGAASDPKFGLDRGSKDEATNEPTKPGKPGPKLTGTVPNFRSAPQSFAYTAPN